MDLRPPPPRPPPGSSSAGPGGVGSLLRKQALAGAHRSASSHVSTVLEEPGAGGAADPTALRGPEPEQAGTSGRSVELRPWEDYWDACKKVELPGR